MLANSVLLICREPALVEQVRDGIGPRPGGRLDVIGDFDQACVEIEEKNPGLIAIHLDESTGAQQVCRLLWLSSLKSRHVPVLAVSETYEPREATDMLRMGVSDYVSRADHLDKLGTVIATLTQNPRKSAPPNEKPEARRARGQRPAPSPPS
jgi:DNA-binding response OmpR family regulator